jgi:hypothetical protein
MDFADLYSRSVDTKPDPEVITAGRLELDAARAALRRLPEHERATLLISPIALTE